MYDYISDNLRKFVERYNVYSDRDYLTDLKDYVEHDVQLLLEIAKYSNNKLLVVSDRMHCYLIFVSNALQPMLHCYSFLSNTLVSHLIINSNYTLQVIKAGKLNSIDIASLELEEQLSLILHTIQLQD